MAMNDPIYQAFRRAYSDGVVVTTRCPAIAAYVLRDMIDAGEDVPYVIEQATMLMLSGSGRASSEAVGILLKVIGGDWRLMRSVAGTVLPHRGRGKSIRRLVGKVIDRVPMPELIAHMDEVGEHGITLRDLIRLARPGGANGGNAQRRRFYRDAIDGRVV